MCIGKPECQRCETCGMLKYQLWASAEMHARGCPWGFERMDRCPDAIGTGKLVFWAANEGVEITERGRMLIAQLSAAGVDLAAPAVEWEP